MVTIIITERETGWLEGIIDGEGCITLGKSANKAYARGFTWRVRTRINMTHKKTVEKCMILTKEITGINEGSIGSINPQKKRSNHKVCHALTLRAKASLLLLKKIKLVTKERQRILAIEALELLRMNKRKHTNDVRLEEIYQEMKDLNKKGK